MDQMDIRSRLIIHRGFKKPAILWMEWNGSFEYVGSWLCKEIRILLQKYSVENVEIMLQGLELTYIRKDKYQCFDPEDLIPFIKGNTAYMIDDYDDIEYEYMLNFESCTFVGTGRGETRVLSFDQILAGKEFVGGDSDEPPEAVSDKANDAFEAIAGILKTLTEAEKVNVIERIKQL